MIPSVISQQAQRGVEEFLRSTFPIYSPFFAGLVDRFLERSGEIFKGPYLSAKLPFAPGERGREYFPDVPMEFPSYRHQEQAFARLSGATPQSTLVATGTGSGKTECFLFPILDHCWRHRGEPGIKAIIIYPMNALATDQAKRIARLIHDNERLNGTLRAGLYVGDRSGGGGSMSMTPERVITNRDTMRLSPPDILLTNYKMLDYLMIRPQDFPLWQHNGPETLKYVVVDELHTFDGAQGTDLACLLRRMKARLRTPEEYLCAVGTSATLGGEGTAGRLLEYAGQVFGEPFDDDAVVTESVLQPQEFFGDSLIDMSFLVPGPGQAAALRPEAYGDVPEYIAAQARLWFGQDLDISTSEGRLTLGKNLLGHVFFRNLITVVTRRLQTLDEVVDVLKRGSRELESGDKAYRHDLLASLLAAVSHARRYRPRDTNDPPADATQEVIVGFLKGLGENEERRRLRPMLDVRLQLWMRELRRLVGDVKPEPDIRFADDLTPEQAKRHLPIVHCRECGTMGWLGTKRQQDDEINPDLRHTYEAFFGYSPTTHFLFPDGQPAADADRQFAQLVCGHCLQLTTGAEVETCPGCGESDQLVPVYAWNPRTETRTGRLTSSHNCPYCGGQESLSIMGSRAASLISVAISQLISSVFNDDKKLLAFSDSVQDAAHRAGFFGARTYRFNFRAALQQFIAGTDGPITLADAPAAFVAHYRQRWGSNDYLATLMPPDLFWLDDYEHLLNIGKLPEDSDLVGVLNRRLGWEIYSELAFRSRIGRTLEKSGCAVASVDGSAVVAGARHCIEALRNEIGGLHGLSEGRLVAFITGFLALMKTKGAVFRPDLELYVEQLGGWYMLNKAIHTPRFGRRTRTPVFLSSKRGTRFDTIMARGTTRTWYQDWARRSFADLAPNVWDYAEDLYRIVLEALVGTGVLAVKQVKGETVWGLCEDSLLIGTSVSECRCGTCGHTVSVGGDAGVWGGMSCLRLKCPGTYAVSAMERDYYGQLYSGGDIQRIFPAEHTALLGREKREETESRFIDRRYPWDPNLLSCTPTLEMGIDIGDLSSAILCSVPPTQANYLQRVGRTGRRDGNSFSLAIANGRPHDLYFYAQPLEMMAGDVEPPGCFLNASSVLARQFTAFCFDRWVETGVGVDVLPGKLGKVLNNLTAKGKEFLFPFVFLDFIEKNRTALLGAFGGLFRDLPEPTVERLRLAVEGDGGEHPGVRVSILQGMEEVAEELRVLRKRVRDLGKTIKKMEESTTKDVDYQEDLDQLEIERSSLRSIAHSIVNKDTYNFFTDEGLLPNYAFPEGGVQLRSVILRRKKREDGRGKFQATVYEYERPAVSAIHELAPSNRFYAEGRKVSIDQVDMRLSEVEQWRFCDCCPHVQRVVSDDPVTAACPVCGSPMWSDAGQVRHMIRMRQVIATTMDSNSRIQDDSDDREPEFFNKMMTGEPASGSVEVAWRLDSSDLPFGFEFLRSVSFREVNFGNRNSVGESLQIANRPVPKTGFVICRTCGKFKKTGPKYDRDEFEHAISCPSRKSGSQATLLDCIYLYREFSSEAIRILLPVTTFAGGEQKLQSFIAAIVFGLKRRFHGNIDHLQTTTVEEPIPDNQSIRKQYLLLYDKVPGGTGYLKELIEDGQTMMDLFADALQGLRDCDCQQDPEKDGCYRCLYGYRSSFDMPDISRSVAMDLLADILARRDKLIPTDTVTTISQNTFIESELEAYFIEALHRSRYADAPTLLRKEIVHHRTGWYCKVGGHGYYVAPQIDLGENDGVPIPTRPDFMFYPEHERETRPIAVYLDGFAYHADTAGGKSRVGDDTAKRMGLIRSGRYWVWSLTWNDVKNQFETVNAYFSPHVKKTSAREQKLRRSFNENTDVLSVKDTHETDAFRLFVEYLANPRESAWRANAFCHMLMCMELRKQDPEKVRASIATTQEQHALPLGQTVDPSVAGIVGGELHEDADDVRRMDLLAWTHLSAIKGAETASLELVCCLDDVTVNDAAAFRRSWNGFLRLFNLLQFLPGAWFVTVQGSSDGDYVPLEFTGHPGAGTTTTADEGSSLSGLADVLETDLLAALGELEKRGVKLPDAETVPFELCGKDGEVLAEAELGWEDRRVVFAYARDEDALKVFASAGWTARKVEELVACPGDFVDLLKAGDQI